MQSVWKCQGLIPYSTACDASLDLIGLRAGSALTSATAYDCRDLRLQRRHVGGTDDLVAHHALRVEYKGSRERHNLELLGDRTVSIEHDWEARSHVLGKRSDHCCGFLDIDRKQCHALHL